MSDTDKIVHTTYLRPVLVPEQCKVVIRKMVRMIKQSEIKFDTIAFRGMSGALIAPVIADRLGKDVVMIRKDDGNHSGYRVEGRICAKNYIIIDDLISTGETLRLIIRTLNEKRDSTIDHIPNCVGIFLYSDSRGDDGLDCDGKVYPVRAFYHNKEMTEMYYRGKLRKIKPPTIKKANENTTPVPNLNITV